MAAAKTDTTELEVTLLPELPTIAEKPIRIITPADQIVDTTTGLPAHVVDLLPPDWTAHPADPVPLLALEPTPRRSKGTVTVDSATDLVTAVEQRRLTDIDPVLYAQPRNLRIVAVLNDDHTDEPGWGDYSVAAQLERTPEWSAWLTGQKMHSQEEFAEFIEDHLEDIETPLAADMLELAQTFQAHTTVRFARSSRLSSGVIALTYAETQEASAGADGSIQIPSEFTLVIRPFYGAYRRRVLARLRYRVRGGELQLGWKLHRPEDIETTVFEEQAGEAGAALGVEVIAGRRG